MTSQPNNPLHGISLHKIVFELYEAFWREELGKIVPINCFKSNPSVNSSLKFLRTTPRARQQVEDLYLDWKASQKM
jgi:uncharacterized protein (DUF2132 family)